MEGLEISPSQQFAFLNVVDVAQRKSKKDNDIAAYVAAVVQTLVEKGSKSFFGGAAKPIILEVQLPEGTKVPAGIGNNTLVHLVGGYTALRAEGEFNITIRVHAAGIVAAKATNAS